MLKICFESHKRYQGNLALYNLAPYNLATGQFGNGQFGSKSIWHYDNKAALGQAGQGGRGEQGSSQEEGVGKEGEREAGGGEESSLESPCPGQRSDAWGVCLYCLI